MLFGRRAPRGLLGKAQRNLELLIRRARESMAGVPELYRPGAHAKLARFPSYRFLDVRLGKQLRMAAARLSHPRMFAGPATMPEENNSCMAQTWRLGRHAAMRQ